MNVECAVWDVERDVERGAGDDCCAHPPLLNHNYKANTIEYNTYVQLQMQIQYTYTYQPCWLTNNQTPSLWRGRWGSFDSPPPLLQDCSCALATPSPSTTMYLLWGTPCGGWFEPFDWRAFVNFEFGPFSFPPSSVTPNCCTKGQTPVHPVESWSSEWELISESILTTSLRSECAFANCTAGDASELFINRAKLLVNCVLSIMPACSH